MPKIWVLQKLMGLCMDDTMVLKGSWNLHHSWYTGGCLSIELSIMANVYAFDVTSCWHAMDTVGIQ